jgi:hypothetical protein
VTGRICVVLLAAAATAAAGPSPERCQAGARFAAHGDLPRAALYLDGCADAAERAVKKQLDASQLSELSIDSDPPGVVAELDALPGEQLVTPATVWVRAGHHELHAIGSTQPLAMIEVKPRTRATVVLEVPKAAAPGGNGHVDFNEDNAGEVAGTAPPPPVKHPPMLECKFTKTCAASGVQLDDPLALQAAAPPRYPRSALELRVGAGDAAKGIMPSVAAMFGARIWGDAHPLGFALRGDWSRRADHDALGFSDTLTQVIAAPDAAWLALAAGGKYSSYDGMAPVAAVELALRRLPVTLGVRWELRDVLLEVGVGWRRY